MEIRTLVELPGAIPLLAEWFHREWNQFDSRSRSDIETQLHSNLNHGRLPITFLALSRTEVVGTVSLDQSDLPDYDDWSPWLTSLYVVPSHRGTGVASALITRLLAFAKEQGVSPIYLWTPGDTRLYERHGWKTLCSDVYGGHPITIMCCS